MRRKRACEMKQKAFFIIFKGFWLKQIKIKFFGRLESDFKRKLTRGMASVSRYLFKTSIKHVLCVFVCVSRGKNCSAFGRFVVLCFLVTPVFRFALLPYPRWIFFGQWLTNDDAIVSLTNETAVGGGPHYRSSLSDMNQIRTCV